MVVTARVIAGPGDNRQTAAPQSLALSVELPMSAGQPGGNAQTAAPDGQSGVSIPFPTAPAVRDILAFRPDADGPEAAAGRVSRLRLTPDLSVTTGTRLRPVADGDDPSDMTFGPVPQDMQSMTGRQQGDDPTISSGESVPSHQSADIQALSGPVPAVVPAAQDAAPAPVHAPPRTDPGPLAGGPPDTQTLNREPEMQAYANSPVTPMHADPAVHRQPERFAPGASEAVSGEDENPLRALLREVVREEFEGELARSLDENLRRMVRHEIAAALTEALVRRPRG